MNNECTRSISIFHWSCVLWNVECLVCTPRTGTEVMTTGGAVCGIHGKTVTRKLNDGKNFEKAIQYLYIYIYILYILSHHNFM